MLTRTDLYLLCALALAVDRPPYLRLAKTARVSTSSVHNAVRRATLVGLVHDRRIVRVPFLDFLEYGVPYAYATPRTGPTRGMFTGRARFGMRDVPGPNALAPVWPLDRGRHYGYGLAPLHPQAPRAAKHDSTFYILLSLIDVLRDSGGEDRRWAMRQIDRRI